MSLRHHLITKFPCISRFKYHYRTAVNDYGLLFVHKNCCLSGRTLVYVELAFGPEMQGSGGKRNQPVPDGGFELRREFVCLFDLSGMYFFSVHILRISEEERKVFVGLFRHLAGHRALVAANALIA